MENLINLVPEQLVIVVAALYVVGMILKNTPKVADWTIPYILLIVGILGSIAVMGFTASAIIQGVICTGVAVLTNQFIKQTSERNREE